MYNLRNLIDKLRTDQETKQGLHELVSLPVINNALLEDEVEKLKHRTFLINELSKVENKYLDEIKELAKIRLLAEQKVRNAEEALKNARTEYMHVYGNFVSGESRKQQAYGNILPSHSKIASF